ncbi:MAG: DNA polymerase III subunit alpha [Rickettsiales bacterium]
MNKLIENINEDMKENKYNEDNNIKNNNIADNIVLDNNIIKNIDNYSDTNAINLDNNITKKIDNNFNIVDKIEAENTNNNSNIVNNEMEDDFLHFTYSSYSFLQSMLKVKDIVKLAKENNMKSVALVDDANLFGSLEFNLEAVKNKIKPINGLTTNLLINNEYYAIKLLALNEIGYKNLIKLSSYIYIHNNQNIQKHITEEQLYNNSQFLVLIFDYLGGIFVRYIEKKISKIELDKTIERLKNHFQNNIYLEIQRHQIQKEQEVEEEYISLAIDYDLPLLATNKVLFQNIHAFEAHDILICISDREKKINTERRCSNNQFYFKSIKEMKELFNDLPTCIINNINLAKRCNFILFESKPELPNFNNDNFNEEDILTLESYKGLIIKLIYKVYNDYKTQKDFQNNNDLVKNLHQFFNIIKNLSILDIKLLIFNIAKFVNIEQLIKITKFNNEQNKINKIQQDTLETHNKEEEYNKKINLKNETNETNEKAKLKDAQLISNKVEYIALEEFNSLLSSIEILQKVNSELSNTNNISNTDNVSDIDNLLSINSNINSPSNDNLAFSVNNLIHYICIKYPDYFERLEYELSVICKMDFAGYFLIVSDFVKWSKENGISVGPGRGSGAGAIVAWCLQITELDPIEYGLIFERFLNPDRVSMPDFDIDFCQKNREKVIKYVINKYGEERVAQIITFGTLQAKVVIKDVGRAMNLPFRYANRLTELIPFNAVSPVTLEQAVQEVIELNLAYKGHGFYSKSDSNAAVDKGEEDQEMNALMKEVLEYALMLEGLHRHASVHAAGIIIAKNPLMEKVGLYKEEDSTLNVIQASMKYAEKLGLVKFDFLGLQTLTLIAECCALIKHNRNIDIDIENIPLDDKKTFEMLSCADAIGVFQLEGGMVNVLKQVRPDSVRDIMALTALYRPGPMDNIQTFINCKHGKQEAVYLHPKMEISLKETYGVIVYQEQVIELAKVLAGYSLGGADNLRRAMGKKNKQEMDMQRNLFISGCKKNDISEKLAEEIFDSIEKFAGYGFNKAHAAAYALISYQTAYLKANFKLEFLVTFLNLEIHDHKKISALISYAKKSNIKILKPNINRPSSYFKIFDDNTIVFGLAAIKGITQKTIEDIELQHNGNNFTSIFDFLDKMHSIKNFNKKTLEGLIIAGVFDDLEQNRKMLFENVENILKYLDKVKLEATTQQLNFFSIDNSLNNMKENIFVETNNWNIIEQLTYEFDALGVFIDLHPIEIYRQYFNLKFVNFEAVKNMKIGRHTVTLPGFIEAKFAKKSPRGKYLNLKLSDEKNIFEISVFDEKILETSADLLEEKKLVIVECDLIINEGSYKLMAKTFININNYCKNMYKHLDLKIDTEKDLNIVLQYLKSLENPQGNNSVMLFVKEGNFYLKVDLNIKLDLAVDDIIFLKQYIK